MDKDQRALKLKQIESDTRCGIRRILYVPPAVPLKFVKIIKWLVLFVGVVVALMPTIFGAPIVVGAIGIEIMFLDLCFWR